MTIKRRKNQHSKKKFLYGKEYNQLFLWLTKPNKTINPVEIRVHTSEVFYLYLTDPTMFHTVESITLFGHDIYGIEHSDLMIQRNGLEYTLDFLCEIPLYNATIPEMKIYIKRFYLHLQDSRWIILQNQKLKEEQK